MLGVCMGNAGQPYSCTTCDSHRKDKMLTINPLDKNLVQQIKYEGHTGKIYSENEQINEDLNDTLNLNYEGSDFSLCRNRYYALEACKDKLNAMRRNKPGDWPKSSLEKLLNIYGNKDKEGKYKEYSGIVIWYLKKKLKR